MNDIFKKIKNTMKTIKKKYHNDVKNIEKKPGTSELLDWVHALTLSGISPQQIEEKLPFAGILLKKDNDLKMISQNW